MCNRYFCFFAIIMVGFFISSCSSTSLMARDMMTTKVAEDHGFTKKEVSGGLFNLTTFQKITEIKKPYIFYIEGDGYAFDPNTQRITSNPTPRNMMMLRLAIRDKRPNVTYIARPCQFTPIHTQGNCHEIYWSDKRMSEEVVESINEVINKISSHKHPIDLVGFSGGGGIAVLVAERNKNVKSIVTIGGNLDHVSFNKYHNVRPMIGSLNPIDYATKINTMPQMHFAGGKDKVVPPFIAQDFVSASKNNKCVKSLINNNASHVNGWEEYFQKNAIEAPICR
ncbi:MAG: dienelactone hydrolase family protein [Rickettsiaceae bacterium]|nr:dienelactone hydrolase family protein [Rickettsiaceae bacterium]